MEDYDRFYTSFFIIIWDFAGFLQIAKPNKMDNLFLSANVMWA